MTGTAATPGPNLPQVAWAMGLLWLVSGSVVAAIGLAGAKGRLPRQHWAGIRLPSTMRDDTAWYAAHRAGGPLIAAGGGIAALAGLAMLALRPDEDVTATASLVAAGAVLGCVTIGGVLGTRAARRR